MKLEVDKFYKDSEGNHFHIGFEENGVYYGWWHEQCLDGEARSPIAFNLDGMQIWSFGRGGPETWELKGPLLEPVSEAETKRLRDEIG